MSERANTHVVLWVAFCLLGAAACDEDKQKNGVGDPCANNTDCADSICHSGICVSRNPLKNGAPCQNKAYCKSLKCVGGVCVSDGRPNGAICLYDEECAAGVCTAGICGTPELPDGGVLVDLPVPDRGKDLAPPVRDAWSERSGEFDQWISSPDNWIGMPDLPVTCDAAKIGKACTQIGGECGVAATCLITDAANSRGVCTCLCTPDDYQTPYVVEDTCPNLSKNICGEVSMTSGTIEHHCFQRCTPKLGSSTCDGKLACRPLSEALTPYAETAVCGYYGCEKGADCPVRLSTACVTTPNSCPTGQVCIPWTNTTTAGRCAKAGVCDLASGLCDGHSLGKATAKVGDTCADDTQCGKYMQCSQEFDEAKYLKKWKAACSDHQECCSKLCQAGYCTKGLCTVKNRGGYCTIFGCAHSATLAGRACPTGSTCNLIWSGGMCQKTCSLTSTTDCRGKSGDLFGDYECRAWNMLTFTVSGTKVAASPVCDYGTTQRCINFSHLTGCDVLGETGNPTNMACRSLDNKVLIDKYDPTGFCLDNTSSGTKLRSPLPTP